MAFTREYIRKLAKECEVELPKDFINGLIDAHIEARDAYAEEQAKKQPETNPANVKDSEEYKALKKEFDDYKGEVEAKNARATKEQAVRAYFESKGIKGKNLDIAIRGSRSEIDGVELDGDKIKDSTALDALISGDFAGLVSKTNRTGAKTENPPANDGGAKLTKADIYKRDEHGRYVMSTAERQKALAENPDLMN